MFVCLSPLFMFPYWVIERKLGYSFHLCILKQWTHRHTHTQDRKIIWFVWLNDLVPKVGEWWTCWWTCRTRICSRHWRVQIRSGVQVSSGLARTVNMKSCCDDLTKSFHFCGHFLQTEDNHKHLEPLCYKHFIQVYFTSYAMEAWCVYLIFGIPYYCRLLKNF